MIFINYLNKTINMSHSFEGLNVALEPYRYDNIHLEIKVERDLIIDTELKSHGIEDIDAFLFMLSRCNLAPHEGKVLKKFELSPYVKMHKEIVLHMEMLHDRYISEKTILEKWCAEKLDPAANKNFIQRLHAGLEKINEFDITQLYRQINNLDDAGKRLYVNTLKIS